LAIGQAIVAAVIAATAWAAGSLVDGALRRIRRTRRTRPAGRTVVVSDEAPMPWAMTMALGFAVVGQVLTLAGLAGMLRKPVVLAVAIGVHVAAIPAWRRVVATASAASARHVTRVPGGRASGVVVVAVTVFIAIALTAFVITLYPPLGFDQTMYHLPQARAFAASGGLPFLPALRYPMFPPLAEVLNASVLMFAGDVATQATGWVALVACVGLASVWARDLAVDEITGDDGTGNDWTSNDCAGDGSSDASSRASGSLAAAAIAGSPIALYLAATGYVEPLLALLGGGALYAADRGRFRVRAGARITTDARWLVAAGVLAGSAASVKYLGLYFVPAAAILILYHAPRRVMPRGLVIYAVAATAALLPCYGRLIAHTGNPVFPFYPEVFGANQWAEDVIMGPGGATRWMLTVTRLWDVTFRREAIGGLPHFSPAFLFALPLIVMAAWHARRFRAPLLIAIGYMVLAPTHAHYLFTIAVLWSALAGAAAVLLLNARSRGRANLMIAAAVVLACGGEAYALHRVYRLGPPPVTSEGREQLLAEQRPLYPAIAWLNRTAGAVTLYAVDAELMVDYASGTLLGDYNGPASFDRMEARVRTTGSVAAALDAIGASHLLVPAHASFWNTEASRDPRLTRIYDDGRAAVYRLR
jgi:hypothetical protein